MLRVVLCPAFYGCQAVQGENGYFMALDMETGGVSMIPLHGLQKAQQVDSCFVHSNGVRSHNNGAAGEEPSLDLRKQWGQCPASTESSRGSK